MAESSESAGLLVDYDGNENIESSVPGQNEDIENAQSQAEPGYTPVNSFYCKPVNFLTTLNFVVSATSLIFLLASFIVIRVGPFTHGYWYIENLGSLAIFVRTSLGPIFFLCHPNIAPRCPLHSSSLSST
jgi:hypothetical protein